MRILRHKKILFLLFLLLMIAALTVTIRVLPFGQIGQYAADRWASDGAYAQISVFATDDAALSESDVFVLREKLSATLTEADSDTAENASYIDCYSAKGKLTVASEQTTADFTAYGVGGDFFFFHPFTLTSGAYFSDDSMSDDYILLDEDCAWQLFGSTDIAGMEVTVGDTPLVVAGVVVRENVLFSEAAGNTKPTVFVSYQTLLAAEGDAPISCCEIVLPNLTTGYAKKLVKENLSLKSSRREIVENTGRFGFSRLLSSMTKFATRSMQKKALAYPYWENQARAVCDLCTMLLFFLLLAAAALVICAVIWFVLPPILRRRRALRGEMSEK